MQGVDLIFFSVLAYMVIIGVSFVGFAALSVYTFHQSLSGEVPIIT